MSSSQIMQNLLAMPGRFRQQLGNTRRGFATDKPKGQVLRTSFAIHRPVWVTAGGAAYTTAGAVYLTLRYLRRLK